MAVKYNFVLRVYKDSYQPIWYDFNRIIISDIVLITKPGKFISANFHNQNQKKFGYRLNPQAKFKKVAGSNSAPILSFTGEYIDIIIKDFPRWPCLAQDFHNARNTMRSGVVESFRGDGFEELHYDILNLKYHDRLPNN